MKIYLGKNIGRLERKETLQKVLGHYCKLHGILYDNSNIDDNEFPIALGPYGKPYLAAMPRNAEIHFSISHSGLFWACAVADSPVGLDLEDVEEREARKARRAGRAEERGRDHAFWCRQIARRFFTPQEIAFAGSQEAFYEIWTCKEAYVKYKGTGISEGLSTFSVVDDDGRTVSKIGDVFLRKIVWTQCAGAQGRKIFGAYCAAKTYELGEADWIGVESIEGKRAESNRTE